MARIARLIAAGIALWLGVSIACAKGIDPKFQGYWLLDVARSDFSGQPAPKSGLVNWTEHGLVFAIVTSDGGLYADAIQTDHGCTLIGVPADYSCTISVVSPRHLHLILKQGQALRRVGDIELVDDKTTKTTHQVTPADGKPYTETTIWSRAQ